MSLKGDCFVLVVVGLAGVRVLLGCDFLDESSIGWRREGMGFEGVSRRVRDFVRAVVVVDGAGVIVGLVGETTFLRAGRGIIEIR